MRRLSDPRHLVWIGVLGILALAAVPASGPIRVVTAVVGVLFLLGRWLDRLDADTLARRIELEDANAGRRRPSWKWLASLACLIGSATFAYLALQPMYEDWRNVLGSGRNGLMSGTLLLIAAWFSGTPRAAQLGPSGPGPSPAASRIAIASFVVVLAIGVFFRTYAFQDLPPLHGVGIEENLRAGRVHAFMHAEFLTPVYPLLLVLTSQSFEHFGLTIEAMRFPMVMVGIVGVVFFLLLARELFEREVAWFVAGLWAVCRTAAFTTRLLDELCFDVTFVIITLYVLVKAVKTGRPIWYGWLGLLCAYLGYAYIAFKLLPPLVISYLAFLGLRGGVRRFKHTARPGAGDAVSPLDSKPWCAFYFVAALALGLAPLLINGEQIAYFRDALSRHGAAERVGSEGLLTIAATAARALRTSFAVLLYQPAADEFLPNPDRPLLELGTAVLGTCGLIYSALTFWKPFRALLLGCVAIFIVPAAVFANNFWVERFLAVVPLLVLLAGMPLDDLGRTLRGREPRLFRALLALMAVVFLFEAAQNFRALFIEARNDVSLPLTYRDPRLAISFYGNDRRETAEVFAWGESLELSNLYWESDYRWAWPQPRPNGKALAQPFEELPLTPRPHGLPAGFAFVQSSMKRTDWAALFQAVYPGALAQHGVLDYQGPPDEAFVIEVPRLEQARHSGLWAEEGARDGARWLPRSRGWVARADREDWSLPARSLAAGPWGASSVRLQGLWYVSEPGPLRLGFSGARSGTLRLDGRTILDGAPTGRESREIDLVAGWHPITIEVLPDPAAAGVDLLTRRGGDPRRPILERDLFAMSRFRGLLCRLSFQGRDQERVTEQRFQPAAWPRNLDTLDHNVRRDRALPRVVTESCTGFLGVPDERGWLLAVRTHSGTASLQVDGTAVADVAAGPDSASESTVELPPGRHRLQVDFEYGGVGRIAGFSMWWKMPGGERTLLPPELLTPFAEGSDPLAPTSPAPPPP